MPDFGVEQMEVVAQGLPADPTVLGGIDFPGSPMLQVDLIHIIDQVHDGLLGDVITEPPAEFGGEIVFPVGKSPGAPESPHNAAGGAADAFFHFSGDDGTAAEIDGVAFFQDQDTDLGIFQDKFISGINGGRAPADNGYIDFFLHFLNTSLSLTVLKIMEEIWLSVLRLSSGRTALSIRTTSTYFSLA